MAVAGEVRIDVVHGQLSSSGTGSVNFIVPGMGTPKACLIILTHSAVDGSFDSSSDHSRICIAFTDFSSNTAGRLITAQSEDAAAKEDCDTRKAGTGTNDEYMLLNVGGNVQIQGNLNLIPDGVSVTNGQNIGSSAAFMTIIFFSGDDLQVSIDTVSTPNGVGNTVQTTTGVDADLIFFLGADVSGEGTTSSGINMTFGVAHISKDHYTVTQRCIGWAADHASAAGTPSAHLRTNRCLSILTEAGALDWGLEVTAASSKAFTMTERDNGSGSGMEIYAMSLSFGALNAGVGSIDGPIATGAHVKTGLGWRPQYVGMLLTDLPLETTIDESDQAGVLGISSNAGPGQETCHSWYDDDNAATIDTATYFSSTVVDFYDDVHTTQLQQHSHTSFDSDGWTNEVEAEDETTAKKWFYWAIETNEKDSETLTELSGGILGLQNSYAGPFEI